MIRRIELPITSRPDAVSRIVHWPSSRLSDLPMAWLRAARWSVAMAKRAYPVIFVFAIFATLLVTTIALRLAIWLPISAIKSAL
jgi:hypothetical protein